MERDVVISVNGLNKTFYERNTINNLFRKKRKAHHAIKDLSFEVYRGEIFGIIGRNGSGKSTLLKILLGGMPADQPGCVEVDGKVMRMALGMGFNSNLSARDNIYINGSILGLSFKEIGNRFQKIIDFAEIHDFVDTQIKFYSSGMKSRLAFAIAIHAEADIFLLDEFFGGVGDESFKKKSQDAFDDLISHGRTIVLVSHSLGIIRNNCSRVLILDKGEHIATGEPEAMVRLYRKTIKLKQNVK